ncbi:MAG: hypothetical protein ACLP5V_00270 [Candidatus Bathyarchaeia archaeon]
MTPIRPNSIRRDVSINAPGPTLITRARTLKSEQNRNRGYWSRISKIAKAIILELGDNAKSGKYNKYTAQPRRTQGINAGDSLIDKRSHFNTASGIADPYGLITRWQTRTEVGSEVGSSKLRTSNP